LTYLGCISLLLLLHHVLPKFLRDSTKDCKNTGFDFTTRINSFQLLTTRISDFKNNSPLLDHTQLNYWRPQATAFNSFGIKYHKNQLVKFPIHLHDISFIIRPTTLITTLKIQNTYVEFNHTQYRILKASDTYKITNHQQQHFNNSKLYKSHGIRPHAIIQTHDSSCHDTQITITLAQTNILYTNTTILISTTKISHLSLAHAHKLIYQEPDTGYRSSME
jgi:hypothetical protein